MKIGSYRSIVKLTGRPEASDSRTSLQSASVVFSTIAQPWIRGLESGASLSGSTSR